MAQPILSRRKLAPDEQGIVDTASGPKEGESPTAADQNKSSQSPTDTTVMKETHTKPTQLKKKSSIFGASCNSVNSIFGAGIIGIPYALRQAGLVAEVLLLLLVGWMTGEYLRFSLLCAANG